MQSDNDVVVIADPVLSPEKRMMLAAKTLIPHSKCIVCNKSASVKDYFEHYNEKNKRCFLQFFKLYNVGEARIPYTAVDCNACDGKGVVEVEVPPSKWYNCCSTSSASKKTCNKCEGNGGSLVHDKPRSNKKSVRPKPSASASKDSESSSHMKVDIDDFLETLKKLPSLPSLPDDKSGHPEQQQEFSRSCSNSTVPPAPALLRFGTPKLPSNIPGDKPIQAHSLRRLTESDSSWQYGAVFVGVIIVVGLVFRNLFRSSKTNLIPQHRDD